MSTESIETMPMLTQLLLVIFASFVNMLIGSLWYGPVFGDQFLYLAYGPKKKFTKSPVVGFVVSTVGAILKSLLLLQVFLQFNISTIKPMLLVMGTIWVYQSVEVATHAEFEERPRRLTLLTISYMLTCNIITILIFCWWL